MGTFFKQLYRYTRPRAFRHNENLWPYLKISRATTGEIDSFIYKKKAVPLIPLSELKNAFKGDILLTATGPSVKDIDFNKFPDIPAIGVNGSYYLHEKVSFILYLIVDMGFIDKRLDIIRDIINNDRLILLTTAHGIVRIIDAFGFESIKCRLSIIEDIACKVYQPKIKGQQLYTTYSSHKAIFFDEKMTGFNTDIRSGIFDAGTVVYWSFQILLYLGFKKIYIIGLDMNNFDQPRFYENSKESLPSMLPQIVEDTIMPSFRHASLVMKERGISVLNLSLASAINENIFNKANYNDIF